MSITDELRKWGEDYLDFGNPPSEEFNNDFLSIADRIDKAHEKAKTATWQTAYSQGVHDKTIPDGYIELPKDSNGAYIRPGDEVFYDSTDYALTITTLRYGKTGWMLAFNERSDRYRPSDVTLEKKQDTLKQVYRDADLAVQDYSVKFHGPWNTRTEVEMEAWKACHLLDRMKKILEGESWRTSRQ